MARTNGLLFLVAFIWLGCSASAVPANGVKDDYRDLVALFSDWRTFQQPALRDGIPDYSKEAMAIQHRGLTRFRARLASIDTTGWSVENRIDYELVGAEMNGLDFDHRVLRPWENNPAFYTMIFASQTDIPAREGPVVFGAIESWKYSTPISAADATEFQFRARKIPALLQRARTWLTGNQRDMWVAGIRVIDQQATTLDRLAASYSDMYPALSAELVTAAQASREFAVWLEEMAPSKTGPSGIGREHYSWNLKNVHLLPYTWEEEVVIVERELARAWSALSLEEHRNRDLPELERISDVAEYDRRMNAAVTEYLAFLEEEEVLPIKPYMDRALRERLGRFAPATGLRSFFSEVNYRDPVVMRTHHYHWFDLARMQAEPHNSPIRSVPLLYNIFDGRAEGLATGFEEMMMHAGLLDDRPRARELIWILLAQRAARALAGLYLHANKFSLEEAAAFAEKWTPRGWLPKESDLVRSEQHLYLQQPGYGTSYVVGKVEVEHLLAEMARQKADAFTLKEFMDVLNKTGIIPVSLIHWEMTGDESRVPRRKP